MHSIIVQIGPFAIRAYGLALAISFLAGVILAMHRAGKFGIPSVRVIDLSIVILFAAVIGSRFFYVIYHLDEFEGHYWDIINPFQSTGVVGIAGLSMMGGIVLVVITGIFFILKWKLPFRETLDAFSPSFLLGVGITRIGCFLNGCCYGVPTDWWWGVVFPDECAAGWHFPHTAIHPTQLISSVAGFLMFGLLLFLEKRAKFRGFTFLMMLAMYSAFRFIIDFFRYYEPSMVAFSIGGVDFSNNQVIAVIILVVAVIIMIVTSRRQKMVRQT
jgi:phosphatidylglycerol:prolipoprotein diacylglycerol transferase